MNRKTGVPALKILLILTLVLGYSQERADAASPWRWDKALKQEKVKDAMMMPSALFVDEKKELYYIVDTGHNRLISFNRSGELISIFNAGKALDIPSDLVKTNGAGIWIVEKGRNSLSYVDLKKKKVTTNTLTFEEELIYPEKVETYQGLLYVLNKATGDILSYSNELNGINRFSCSECPWGFVDFKIHKEKIWALDQANKTIRCFNLRGKLAKTFELGNSVNFPISLAVGPTGYIYVLDRQRRNIAAYDRHGEFKYRFLEKGIARGQLSYPIEIRFDPWGGLCLVDEGNARVEIFKR